MPPAVVPPVPTPALPGALVLRNPRRVARKAAWLLRLALVGANLIGATLAFVFAVLVLPPAGLKDETGVLRLNLLMTLGYVAFAVPLGMFTAQWCIRSAYRWLIEGRVPTGRETRATQRAPLRMLMVQGALWTGALILFPIVDGLIEPRLIYRAFFTIAFGGTTVCAITYLLAERILRPVVTAALANSEGARRVRTPGVTTRAMLAWALGPGGVTFGLVLIGMFSIIEGRVVGGSQSAPATVEFLTGYVDALGKAMILVGGLALVVGATTTLLGARSVSAPIHSVRVGLGRVEQGDFDARVPVYDGSELGRLQAGFNLMVAGLSEREHLRDLFGRHVGEEVAHQALHRGVELEGQTLEVAVLFVDLIGSTELPASRPPAEVLGLLNRFFKVVVDTVDAHDGWINKFQGDAALAIFGAPGEIDDPAGSALAAGRALAERLPIEVPEVDAGIGVAFGAVVAGNLGDERRYEYTVIGDPVNVAARLQELAKHEPGRLLSTTSTLEATVARDEAARWEATDEISLRGRAEPVRLARPACIPQPRVARPA